MKIKRKLFRDVIFKKDFVIERKNLKIFNFNFEKKKLLIISKKKIIQNFDYIKSFLRFSVESNHFKNISKLFELNFINDFQKNNDFFEDKETILFDEKSEMSETNSVKRKEYIKKYEKFKKNKKFHFFIKILLLLGMICICLIGFEIFLFFDKKKKKIKEHKNHGFHKREATKWKPLSEYHSFKTPAFLKH